jgi:regulator of sigma E protease
MSILLSLLSFLLTITLLVAIHEFGHFIVARKLGVKVLCFSFGFGYPLWSRTDKYGTEFIVRLLPLGGYVKMLDENEGPVPTALLDKAFNRKALWQRTLIVLAGPVANFLLAILLFWILFIKGVPDFAPVVTSIDPDSIASHAGIQINDEIKAINGNPVNTLEAVYVGLMSETGRGGDIQLQVERPSQHHKEMVTIPLPLLQVEEAEHYSKDLFDRLGLHFAEPSIAAIIGQVLPDSPAEKAGLQSGDKITHINQVTVKNWKQMVSYVRLHPDETINVTVERKGQLLTIPVTTNSVIIREQKKLGQIGVMVQVPDIQNHYLRVEKYNPIMALGKSVEKVASVSLLTLKMIGKMLIGQANLEHLNGPLSIAQNAGDSAKLGLFEFLRFLALISISLGVLNLLPIPVLDGGHLFYYAIEAVRGKPLTERGQQIAASIGLSILLLLMAVAFYNDFATIFSAS